MSAGADAPDILWSPSAESAESTAIADYMRWLTATRGLSFNDYRDLHAWSVERLEDFWESLFHYFQIESPTPYACVLTSREMPGARWFPGARVNFARHILRHAAADRLRPAIFHQSEGGSVGQMSWGELEEQVARLASFLRARGIGSGDMVAAYITNIPEAVVAFLAVAAIGAVWSSCSPEFGAEAVRARFVQLAPKVLLTVDGYRFGGKRHDRTSEVRSFAADFQSLELVVHVPSADWTEGRPLVEGAVSWASAVADRGGGLIYEETAFEHPLFVCFSSGTTGLPKAIVHGHGGVTMETLKLHLLQENQTSQSRSFFYSTTGWIVWVCSVVTGLIGGGSIILYDGNPVAPDPASLWRLAAETHASSFGASPVFFAKMMDAGIVPRASHDLSSIRLVMMTGSPASPEVMRWATDNIADDVHVGTLSGGTDLCTAIVGLCPISPSYAGQFQCAQLGVDAAAFSDTGEAIVGAVGELVVRKPMPTMPLHFLNDSQGDHLRESYYDMFPGIWRQGDFFRIEEGGGSVILGRSDATLNRHGIRIGTAEIYRILETIAAVADSLVVNLELPGGRAVMPLFIRLAPGAILDEDLKRTITARLRVEASPRHVPDQLFACPAVPYTITGKKLEVPVKRILLGARVEDVVNIGAVTDPGSLAFFAALAPQLSGRPQ